MSEALTALPRYLVLEPVSTVRLEVTLHRPTGEIDVELENPKPGRSFLLLLGPQGGPIVQRMRLTGRARLVFEAAGNRPHVLMLANPQKEPLVLRLRVKGAKASRRKHRPTKAAPPPRTRSPAKQTARRLRNRAGARVRVPLPERRPEPKG